MNKTFSRENLIANCPCIFVSAGFFILAFLSFFNEYFDFPFLFFGAPATLFNWKEVVVEVVLIGLVGICTVVYLSYSFEKRIAAEQNLLRSQKDLEIEKKKLEEVLNIDCEISSILKVNQLIDFIIMQAVKLLDAGRCSLMMIDKKITN